MHSVAGKVAIFTGASQGIGAAIAKALASAGAAVVVNYASNRDAAVNGIMHPACLWRCAADCRAA
jgi:NAD(P)-dependent dehydrogenase (short-subunit alcohol dehydrogenase family)